MLVCDITTKHIMFIEGTVTYLLSNYYKSLLSLLIHVYVFIVIVSRRVFVIFINILYTVRRSKRELVFVVRVEASCVPLAN